MSKNTYFSQIAPSFQGRKLPVEGTIVGYGAIIETLDLKVPMPKRLAVVSSRNKTYSDNEWMVLPKRYLPEDHKGISEVEALYKQLVFALKYEGVNLLVFKFLTYHYSHEQLTELVDLEPTGQYSRRIWFLVEWLIGKELPGKDDLSRKSYIPLLDDKLQYTIEGIKSSRHLVVNNMPGTVNFCSLISRTQKLDAYLGAKLSERKNDYLKGVHKDILQRASAFLLLKDSKASFTIEGESPRSKRAARWGQAIGQAGTRELNKEEIERLQQIVIENPRFISIGYRTKGGFVGEHDRLSGEPIPDHISAKPEDLNTLMGGLLQTHHLLLKSDFDAVLAATIIAFGFVFIHPLQDGNGRLHRYMVHHILAKKRFSQHGIIFPVSASILEHIDDYRKVLEAYSHPLLDFIEWIETSDHNVKVTNETLDYYRYFDATEQAEFLFDCVNDTIQNIIPAEVDYLQKFDAFKRFLENEFEMPDKMAALLTSYLDQNQGQLSRKKWTKDFGSLTQAEVDSIQSNYLEIFNSDGE